MRNKIFTIILAAAFVNVAFAATVRYEAQSATLANGATVVNATYASGGSFVRMAGGNMTFTVSVPSAGFYTVEARFSQTYDSKKDQNLVINNGPAELISFPLTSNAIDDPVTAATFRTAPIAPKVQLNNGTNTIAITNNWGWVDIDYIEVSPYEATTFNLKTTLANPNATLPARKMFQFLREQFGKKIISGIMTDYGLGASDNIETTPVMAHVKTASGKFPAHVGFDFFHGTGNNSSESWFIAYNDATIRMAKELYAKGGFPTFCWHWKDPMRLTTGDHQFYVRGSGYPNGTDFDLRTAFTNSTYDHWNVDGDVYKALIRDIDMVSDYLKNLQEAGVPVIWRPLHEAAGGWFWWGRDRAAKPCAQLWRLMYDRMVNHHGLNNLIWVWTTEQSGPDKNDGGWYPGDNYVDIIGADIYVPRNNYGPLSNRFEAIKNMFGTDKIIALTENGSIPHPDSLVATGTPWSWWKTWNGEHMTQHNTNAHWNYVMNHNYVITLEDMPGLLGGSWANYALTANVFNPGKSSVSSVVARGAPVVTVTGRILNVKSSTDADMQIRMVNVKGKTVAKFNAAGDARFSIARVPAGRYIVETKVAGRRVGNTAVIVK